MLRLLLMVFSNLVFAMYSASFGRFLFRRGRRAAAACRSMCMRMQKYAYRACVGVARPCTLYALTAVARLLEIINQLCVLRVAWIGLAQLGMCISSMLGRSSQRSGDQPSVECASSMLECGLGNFWYSVVRCVCLGPLLSRTRSTSCDEPPGMCAR